MKQKYDWVPHEVRGEQTEHFVAYALVVLFAIAVPAMIFLAIAIGMH